ncbi:alpha/beta fold hydrolase [Cohaesibacter gelatinilyticus]|uniref:Haloacetate dehalogenase n=1 Tax=Cohaesibacter gelatinilyticus TaxID=372072 RepID=A0A285PCP7_9HYPH|nr:alpha/beta hydrolase [Cohaesibacter gelatinilyticus]SNZ19535.1 haloacetate dehalogenase [Cohaesibacter gelatinilyticus]
MFQEFVEERVEGDGATLFIRRAGPDGAPPIVLLHGYPQTSAMWHGVAPILARSYQVVCPDLRGYGRSDKPASDPFHQPYSKRAMANDIVAVMQRLGHERFLVGAHDRGARVAHRMGLDHADHVSAMVLLDIAPTREMYAGTNAEFAHAYWHWFFLTQQQPLPEKMIASDPEEFWKLKCFNQARGENPFSSEALKEYLKAFQEPEVIHASCEDYRAAASIDIEHDNADKGRKLTMPLLALWAKRGVIETCFDALDLWYQRAERVEGDALDATHYMAEEIPDEIAARMVGFFSRNPIHAEAAE